MTVSNRHVSDYMHRQLEVVPQDASVVTVADKMRAQQIGSVLVEAFDRPQQDCRLIGIVTETDLVGKILAPGRSPSDAQLTEIMSSPLVTIAPTRPMVDAGHLMETKKVRHLAVSEGADVVGIVSVRDLVRHYVESDEGAVQSLNDVYQPLSVIMTRHVETVASHETAAAAAQRMADKHIGALFVMEAGELVGIVTESDLVRKVLAYQLDPTTLRVGAIMNAPLIDIDISRTIRDASERMAAKRVRHLAVTDRDRVVGILSIRDLVKMVSVRDRPDFLKRGAVWVMAGCLLLNSLAGCASTIVAKPGFDADEEEIIVSHCEPMTTPTTENGAVTPVGAVAGLSAAPMLLDTEPIDPLRFSSRARRIAGTIGVAPLLAELHYLEGEAVGGSQDAPTRMLTLRQELSDRLLLALVEAHSIAAELECEKERAEDLATRLEEVRNDVQQGRTVMAILADSISGVFAGTFLLLGSQVLSGVIDLSGSVASLGFGVSALGGDQSYDFVHGRNLIADLWRGDEAQHQFPRPVWNYLTTPMREGGKRTRRDLIVNHWRERFGKPGSKQEQRLVDLYFGRGGTYQINELRQRSEMLGAVKTHINLMTQELNLLFRETLSRQPARDPNQNST